MADDADSTSRRVFLTGVAATLVAAAAPSLPPITPADYVAALGALGLDLYAWNPRKSGEWTYVEVHARRGGVPDKWQRWHALNKRATADDPSFDDRLTEHLLATGRVA